MDLTVTFYQNSSDNRKVGKTLAVINTVTAKSKHQFTVENVEIVAPEFDGWTQVNYMYVSELNRYYNISDMVRGMGGLLDISGIVDPLETYAGYIRGLYTFVERQEFKYNDMIIDEELPVRLNRVRSMKNIGSFGNPTGTNIVLTVNGGV